MPDDRALGMDVAINRRDFVSGTAIALGALGMAGSPYGALAATGSAQAAYPPARSGLRGSHPGAFEAAHALRDGALKAASATASGETYDLVIVGGGLSGLSAAHFYLKSVGKDARVLILENHDDFGGHAKRNEFRVDGKLMVLNGGTLNIETPSRYNQWARQILDDIGVDLTAYERENENNEKLYAAMGLRSAYFFDRETWRKDSLVVSQPSKVGSGRDTLTPETVALTPLSAKAKADLLRLISPDQPDYLAGKSISEKKAFLAATSFRDYLLNTVKIDEEAYWFFRNMGASSFCVGADANPAIFAWVEDFPGFSGLGLGPVPDNLFDDLPGGHHGRQKEGGKAVHFPDGNATLARLLVASLIPAATPARTQSEIGLAVIDYGQLDKPGQPVRIRLSSTVLNVRHAGDPATATEAIVTYAPSGNRDGAGLTSVRAKQVIMACWNMFIPYLVPELPAAQREALAYGVKGPLVYTSVAVRNWRSFQKLGVSTIRTPTMFHNSVSLSEHVGLGGLQPGQSPDEPAVLKLDKYMSVPGLPKRDQHRAGRAELLALSFEDFERETRSQLARILGPGGFDPARDIAGITVNRWPHGYAYTYNSLFDPPEWVFTETDDRPCVKARKPFGLISIANADAAASPHTDAAFQEAHRAVGEVLARSTFDFVKRA
ncbi:MAG TPA: NAD(P)-binding protein [Sphingomonas sp.]|nr:NAD(P)-binding protein [Sphingomonas sp.]